MANPTASSLPPLNPEHRRVAVSQFEHANQAVATGNYDYGIRLLLMCCKLDPANLIYRQTLRRTEKAKYKNNLRGGWLAWLTTWPAKARTKTALKTGDYLGVLEYGERVLARNPWDVGAQMDMAEAADELGQLDLAVWLLEQARQKSQTLPALNRALARLYEKRGNFTQAIALWNLVRKARPADKEADRKLKDLAVNETIARGNYEGAVADAGAVPKPRRRPVRRADPFQGIPPGRGRAGPRRRPRRRGAGADRPRRPGGRPDPRPPPGRPHQRQPVPAAGGRLPPQRRPGTGPRRLAGGAGPDRQRLRVGRGDDRPGNRAIPPEPGADGGALQGPPRRRGVASTSASASARRSTPANWNCTAARPNASRRR